ncbi:hypothetical protein [Prevotella sp.]
MDEQYQELLRCIESLDARERIQELGGDVLDRIKNRFVLGNPRVWWLSFRFPPKEYHYDDDYQYKRISCFLNNEDFCYFIAELDVTHIFKARVADVVFIIGECSFFEYYVVSMDLKKLICETEHGDFLKITI